MEDENVMDFDDVMEMKERRRNSREKGKKAYDKSKITNKTGKHRNVKKIAYNPALDYEDYEDEDE